ncbi:hypothetical protein GCM10008171_27500 [Methylopila jiangsuensis]|uniref:Uncharacterized protein n=2 Tax=Methylopila jiangsuensis TaxID=586230 RepID=A0A9W6JJE3_9HYPH|nr:hypothetical protein GCM10008171_27500 [Methylopila jiangsuensis]
MTLGDVLDPTHDSRWTAPLAASYLRFAFDWTADGEGTLADAEAALVRGVAILTADLAAQPDDVARLLLVARACEQRCLLRAYGESWTRAARAALDGGDAPAVTGDRRQIRAAGAAATAALDLVALEAPNLAPLAQDLALSCLRLAATLEAAGADEAAGGLLLRAESIMRGVRPAPSPTVSAEPQPISLRAIEGGGQRTPAARPQLRIVTSPTA